jgi:hypothetical protein
VKARTSALRWCVKARTMASEKFIGDARHQGTNPDTGARWLHTHAMVRAFTNHHPNKNKKRYILCVKEFSMRCVKARTTASETHAMVRAFTNHYPNKKNSHMPWFLPSRTNTQTKKILLLIHESIHNRTTKIIHATRRFVFLDRYHS